MNLLIREECNEALDKIQGQCDYLSETFHRFSAWEILESCRIFEKLICEHFDNPPLTHEEIEEGKWYWHNKLKCWMKIINKDVCTEIFSVMENEDGYIYFEEDTYFRKEVQE